MTIYMETEYIAPAYLPPALKEEFTEIAMALDELGLYHRLDADGLARYLLARQAYLVTTQKLNSALMTGEMIKASKLTALQDKFFKQCRAASADVGIALPIRWRMTHEDAAPPLCPGGEPDLFGD